MNEGKALDGSTDSSAILPRRKAKCLGTDADECVVECTGVLLQLFLFLGGIRYSADRTGEKIGLSKEDSVKES